MTGIQGGSHPSGRPHPQTRPGEMPPVCLSEELIVQFLAEKERQGCTRETLSSYGRHLRQLYQELPQDKEILPEILRDWTAALQEGGYAARSINNRISAVNGLLEFCRRRDLQSGILRPSGNTAPPELTRNEYLRLLSTARMLGKEQSYLLVKSFACTGLTVRELPQLTAEAVREGWVVLQAGQKGRSVRIPTALRDELKSYMGRRGIRSGPVFVARNGSRMNRSVVNALIQNLANDAQVTPGKCSPTGLRKLYLTTQEEIKGRLAQLIEREYEQLLDAEQRSVGWEEGK